jgi:hypothetical protein
MAVVPLGYGMGIGAIMANTPQNALLLGESIKQGLAGRSQAALKKQMTEEPTE